jgi:SAM-dependent methyltransferase
MPSPPNQTGRVERYRDAFQSIEDARRYDASQYRPDSYQSFIGDIESKMLQDVVRSRPPGRSLDFACGTGRMTGVLGAVSTEVLGVDISEAMLEIARNTHPSIEFHCLDVSSAAQPKMGVFDTIAMFRLLLNNELDVSIQCLRWAREHLSPGGRVIVNNHGNLLSHKLLSRSKGGGVTGNVMSDDTVRRLGSAAGFDVELAGCTAVLGPTIGKRLGMAGKRLERFAATNRLSHLGSNRLYELTPSETATQ